MTYQVTLASMTDGSTTFDATAAGVHVKDGPAQGPDVVTHIERNEAGAMIDLDGTGAATLVPPLMTFNLIFSAAYPSAHTQYGNLEALKGKHVTLTARIPTNVSYLTKTAPARVMDIRGNWRPPFKAGTQSMIAVAVDIQLKDFF